MIVSFFVTEIHTALSKLSVFLQNTLPKESLSPDAEFCRKECVSVVERITYFLNSSKNNSHTDKMLLNAGLSLSSQSLHDENEINGSSEERITRSGSLPDIQTCQVENSKEWQATRALKVHTIVIVYRSKNLPILVIFNQSRHKKVFISK